MVVTSHLTVRPIENGRVLKWTLHCFWGTSVVEVVISQDKRVTYNMSANDVSYMRMFLHYNCHVISQESERFTPF